jgi:hypothetical protein
MTQDFEHGLVVQSSPLPEHFSGLGAAGVAEVLSRSFVDVASGLDESLAVLDGGGWEVVSHNVVVIERAVVVNFLVRRPRAISRSRSAPG